MKTTAAQEKGNPLAAGRQAAYGTATLDPPAAADASDVITKIRCSDICRSPFNKRKIDKKHPSLPELAKNFKAQGLLQPILVRPIQSGPTPHELVCGERRWTGWQLAYGADALIRCIVRDLTDREAREIIVTENLHREDLTPFEEAEAVADLLELYSGDCKAVASQIGKELKWVARRSRLASLSKNWRNFISDPNSEETLEHWSVGHYEIVARLAPDAQDELLDDVVEMSWVFDGITIDGLENRVGDMLRELSKAPWDLSDQILDPDAGSCVDCTKRSNCHPGLFDDPPDVKPADKCLDAVCWNQKFRAFVRQREDAERKNHPDLVLVRTDHTHEPALAEISHIGPHDFTAAKKTDAGAVPALVVAGKGRGEVKWIKPHNATTSSQSASRPRMDPITGKTKVGPKSMAERRADLEKRRRVKAVAMIAEQVERYGKCPDRDDLALLASLVGTWSKRDLQSDYFWAEEGNEKDLDKALKAAEKQDPGEYGKAWKLFFWFRNNDFEATNQRLWKSIEKVLLHRLRYNGTETNVGQLYAEACQLADLVGIDHEKIKDEADAAIPEPKSWAKELGEQQPTDRKTVSADPKAGQTTAKKGAASGSPAKKKVAKKRQPAGKGVGR